MRDVLACAAGVVLAVMVARGSRGMTISQPEHGKAVPDDQVQFLTRFPAYPLTRYHRP